MRRLIVLSLLWSTWVMPARADERLTAAFYYGGLIVGDLASTKYALDRGLTERNYKSVMHAAVASAVAGIALWCVDSWLEKRDKKAQKLLRIGAGLGFGLVIGNNILKGHNVRTVRGR